MDFDEEFDELSEEYSFWVNVDSSHKNFGKVVIGAVDGKGKFKKAADSFEEFFALWTEFMTQDFKSTIEDGKQKDAVEDWYLRYAE